MLNYQWTESYGTVLHPERIHRIASDITALWETEEMEKLLFLWAKTEDANLPLNSDYEKFRALCLMMPYLNGHPVKRYCADFLKRYFSCELPMDAKHCDEIWRETSERLLLHPLTVADVIGANEEKVYLLCKSEALFEPFPKWIVPELTAEELLNLCVGNFAQWNTSVTQSFDRFAVLGCDRVCFSFADDFVFAVPDLYHVDRAIANRTRDKSERDLLLAQLFRMVCALCVERRWAIHLEIGACGDAVKSLLSYTESAVGLPKIFWSSDSASSRDRLLAFGYQKHESPILSMLRLSSCPSNGELRTLLETYAARYPIGMLFYTIGGDLRMQNAEKSRLEKTLQMREV